MFDDQITLRLPSTLAQFYDAAAEQNGMKTNDLHRFALQFAQNIINEVIEDKPEIMDLSTALLLRGQGIEYGKAKTKTRKLAQPIPYAQIQVIYNGAIKNTNFIESVCLSKKAKTNIKKLFLALKHDLDKTQAYFDFCSGMLKGQDWATGGDGWRADIEYMSREQTYVDCKNGKYS